MVGLVNYTAKARTAMYKRGNGVKSFLATLTALEADSEVSFCHVKE